MIVSYERGISMKQLSELLETVLHDRDITPDAVPALDLYMDQVLTLFNEGLQENKRHLEDKLLTKTMINNYSKEKILLPVKGKKYTRQHIIQMLCIYQLKQMLSLADVKALLGRNDVDFEACFNRFLARKDHLRDSIPERLTADLDIDLSDPNEVLTFCLTLSATATYMQRLCQQIIDARAEAQE